MGEKEIMTIYDLLNLFQNLSKAGKREMKIRCTDGFLHRNEITFSHLDNEVWFRGFLFNQPISDKIREFCRESDVYLINPEAWLYWLEGVLNRGD